MVIQDVIGWLHILPALAGIALCAISAGRSRWAWLLLAAFALELLVTASYRVGSSLIAHGTLSYSQLGIVFSIASLLGLVASCAIVAGVGGLLFELGGRSEPTA